MGRFTVDTNLLIKTILPPVQRGSEPLVQMLRAFLSPLQDVFDECDPIISSLENRARYNGQAIVMRAAIEDFTGISGITVTLYRDADAAFFFTESEAIPFHFSTEAEGFPDFLNLESEGVALQFLYEIGVPTASFSADVVNQITAEVNIFALPTSNFTIVAI